jgi:membrane protein implicated in regulation of membrane protease activity
MKLRAEPVRAALAAGILLALTSGKAAAYIGPGGGLALLSTALAMLAAFSVSAVVVLTWPIRAVKRWLRRRREKGSADAGNGGEDRTAGK